jgi:hypothetical protein
VDRIGIADKAASRFGPRFFNPSLKFTKYLSGINASGSGMYSVMALGVYWCDCEDLLAG